MRIEVGEVLAFAAAMARRTGLGLSEMAALEHLQHSHPHGVGSALSPSSGAVTALVERRPNPADRRSSVVLPVAEDLEEAGRHFVPVAADLLGKTAELTDEEWEAVGKYLEAATEVFRRHARG